jgi:hypothetical protein
MQNTSPWCTQQANSNILSACNQTPHPQHLSYKFYVGCCTMTTKPLHGFMTKSKSKDVANGISESCQLQLQLQWQL